MSAISVEESEEEYEPDREAVMPPYTQSSSFFNIRKRLKVFCYVPTYGIKGIVLISAKNEESARAKLDKFHDVFKYIGVATTLQELLEILKPYSNRHPNEIYRKDLWNFVYDGEEFY